MIIHEISKCYHFEGHSVLVPPWRGLVARLPLGHGGATRFACCLLRPLFQPRTTTATERAHAHGHGVVTSSTSEIQVQAIYNDIPEFTAKFRTSNWV